MDDLKIKSTIEEAEEFLNAAQEELCRPEEDVVHYMVSLNACKAASRYLSSFLLKNGKYLEPTIPIGDLLDECVKTDSRFEPLVLESGYCSLEDVDIYMDIETSKQYMTLAEHSRDVVLGM